MIRYSCTSCQRKLLIKPEAAGQQSTCPCGLSFTVPGVAGNASVAGTASGAVKPAIPAAATPTAKSISKPAPKPSAPPDDTVTRITIDCSKCDRRLRAPATAAGKAVRCVCGQLVLVPHNEGETRRGSTVVSVVKDKQSSDWLSELPPPPRYQAPPPESGAEFWYVDAEDIDHAPPQQTVVPDARQASHEYIRNAEKEIREQRKRGQGEAAGSLGTAQITLILVGLLTIALNAFLLINSTNEVEQVMKEGEVGMSREALLQFVQIFYGSFIAVGVVLILLGALLYQFPLFCPLAGLLVYLLAMGVSAVIDPMSLIKGIIIKVLVIIALAKAVNDGAYYHD